MIEISVIVPTYNEEGNLDLLHTRLSEVMQRIGQPYELIFINDGSKDRTLELERALAQKDPCVKYIDLSRNFGHQIAVSAGLDAARGQAIVIIDADLQDPPELIIDMYAKLRTGFHVVYAKRKARQGENFMKKFTAKLFYRLLSRITSFSIPVDTGDFRIMDKKVVDALKQMPESNKFLRGQIAWIGFNQTFVEYDRQQRHAGTTGYTYKKMINFALNGITAFSNAPIKWVTMAGFMVSVVAFLMIIMSFVVRIFYAHLSEPGWASIMVGMMFLGGVQLISLGIIGEYISRINSDVKRRPLYFVKETNVSSEI
ncbi:MAG: glycosyltransferase [Cytophagales bacterium]|nr:MAG: glycosyltransferase [Cytophagales bacterium]TAF62057.1 MAG: glycosyltransferase [Cytophagales bacterium]